MASCLSRREVAVAVAAAAAARTQGRARAVTTGCRKHDAFGAAQVPRAIKVPFLLVERETLTSALPLGSERVSFSIGQSRCEAQA
eukprot:scaffold27204_cov65-Phaeocystis_antarctica.AAC.3